MKYLKTYSIFESIGLTLEQEKFLNRYTKGIWSLNSEGLVDIQGNFDCSGRNMKTLSGIRFGKVSGDFNCSNNQLTNLDGAPQEVDGSFDCSMNQLTSLEGAAQKVDGDFHCSNNQLTNLDGAPQEVGGGFNCSYNQLTSLEGAPIEVGGGFYCSYNQLTSMEGAPQEVGGYFYCRYNQLTSLEGAPNKYKKIVWSEGDKVFEVILIEKAIEEGSALAWELLPLEGRSDKLNDFIENDPSMIDRLNVLFDRDWYTPSPYAMAIYKAWKRGL